jgi:acetyl-CoA carboxylase biotin carboxyl carrier protein
VDIADLKEILRILEEQDITEFELEQDGVKLRVCRTSTGPSNLPPALPAPAAGAGSAAVVEVPSPGIPANPGSNAGAVGETVEGVVAKSPIVGTFYRAPAPTAPPFVEVGDRVKVGQVLCIIEAMKLMNEIEAETAGEVVRVHVDNGQPVQYGDPLFTILPA